MKRLIDTQLIEWKQKKKRKPLLIRGARQVGKTYSVKQLGRTAFNNNFITIDFERNRNLHTLFQENLDPRQILTQLEVIFNAKIIPGETLLFFDEIQSCPRALMALRYFYEEVPEMHVIAAGSLLEFAIRELSFPVGRIQPLTMYPMNFLEYLWACGHDRLADIIIDKPQVLPETIHQKLFMELKNYFFIGGLPESISTYINAGSMHECFEILKELEISYRQDFAHYTPYADKHCLEAVFQTLARQSGQQIKYARLAEGYSQPTLKKAFELLCLAHIVQKIPSVNPSGLPLSALTSAKVFKTLIIDIGLQQSLCGLSRTPEFIHTDLLAIYRGNLAEQFVGQELRVFKENQLYYWSRAAKSSTAEVDYVVELNGSIYPVEVKNSSAGRLRSLHLFLENYPDSPEGIVFSMQPYAKLPKQKLCFLPLYYVYSWTNQQTSPA